MYRIKTHTHMWDVHVCTCCRYCMPWPRHVLQSVMIPVVTQIRVSGDYSPSNEQWIVGDSALLAHSVGLAAFKDVSSYTQLCTACGHTPS